MRARAAAALLPLALAWIPSSFAEDGRGSRGSEDVRQFYSKYEAALQAHRRDTLVHFYSPDGALIVFNGDRKALSSAQIDSTYRGSWEGPAFFAFDNLQFHALSSAQVVVTGAFRWLRPQAGDTARYVYLALVDRSATGLRIRVEHETVLAHRHR